MLHGVACQDNVAPLQRSSTVWMSARIWSLFAGVGCRHPVTICNGVIDGRVNKVGMSIKHCGTRQECSILLVNEPGPTFAALSLQHASQSQQAA